MKTFILASCALFAAFCGGSWWACGELPWAVTRDEWRADGHFGPVPIYRHIRTGECRYFFQGEWRSWGSPSVAQQSRPTPAPVQVPVKRVAAGKETEVENDDPDFIPMNASPEEIRRRIRASLEEENSALGFPIDAKLLDAEAEKLAKEIEKSRATWLRENPLPVKSATFK